MNFRTGETETDRRAEAAYRAFAPGFTPAQLNAMRGVSDEGLQSALEGLKIERSSLRRDRRWAVAQPDLYVWPVKIERQANEVRRFHARVRKFRAAIAAWDARIAEASPRFLQAA